jgi:hypothetical protein
MHRSAHKTDTTGLTSPAHISCCIVTIVSRPPTHAPHHNHHRRSHHPLHPAPLTSHPPSPLHPPPPPLPETNLALPTRPWRCGPALPGPPPPVAPPAGPSAAATPIPWGPPRCPPRPRFGWTWGWRWPPWRPLPARWRPHRGCPPPRRHPHHLRGRPRWPPRQPQCWPPRPAPTGLARGWRGTWQSPATGPGGLWVHGQTWATPVPWRAWTPQGSCPGRGTPWRTGWRPTPRGVPCRWPGWGCRAPRPRQGTGSWPGRAADPGPCPAWCRRSPGLWAGGGGGGGEGGEGGGGMEEGGEGWPGGRKHGCRWGSG